MKEIERKTKEEQQASETHEEVVVNSTRHFFWICDDCNVAFFDKDMIIRSSSGDYRCPREKIKLKALWFKEKVRCGNRVTGGDEAYFNKCYKFKSTP